MRQPSPGGTAYNDIAEELSGPRPLTLADLDPASVEAARAYAKANHKRWPPAPQVSGWVFQIISIARSE